MRQPSPDPLAREIARLQALVAAADRRRERAQDREAHADRLTLQIRRVELALARVTGRLDRMPPPSSHDDHEARQLLVDQERNLHAKIGTLSSARNAVLTQPHLASRGAHEHLHACLLLHLDALRCDPTSDPALIERTRRQLVELVRGRRALIDGLADGLEAARDATIALVRVATGLEATPSPRELDAAVLERLDDGEAHFARARHRRQALIDQWPSLARLVADALWSADVHADLRILLGSEGASSLRQSGRLEADVLVPVRRLGVQLDHVAGLVRALPAPGG